MIKTHNQISFTLLICTFNKTFEHAKRSELDQNNYKVKIIKFEINAKVLIEKHAYTEEDRSKLKLHPWGLLWILQFTIASLLTTAAKRNKRTYSKSYMREIVFSLYILSAISRTDISTREMWCYYNPVRNYHSHFMFAQKHDLLVHWQVDSILYVLFPS